MFAAIMVMLFAGADVPLAIKADEPPFVSRSACEEWAGLQAPRVERVVGRSPRSMRPVQWEIRCEPLVPDREA